MTGMACGSVHRPGGFVLTDRALTCCGFPAGARVLDVGCGAGATVRHLLQNHALEAHGIDPALPATQDHTRLVRACGEHLPFRDEEMDGVLLECSLSVMEDPDRVLKECNRVLKPEGWLLISDLYARGAAAHLTGCLGRVDRQETICGRIVNHGFTIRQFEDCSEHLLTLWGQRIFEIGAAAFCAELGAAKGVLKAINCGYCLIIARRSGP